MEDLMQGAPGQEDTTQDSLGESSLTMLADYLSESESLKVKLEDASKTRSPVKSSWRTGGPRTEEGKVIASKNSLTHGAYASKLPESVEFKDCLKQARFDLNPCGVVEDKLVESIAHSIAKSRKIRRIQMEMAMREEHVALDTWSLAQRVKFPWGDSHHELLAEPLNEAFLQSFISKQWRRMALPPCDLADGDELSEPDHKLQSIYSDVCDCLSSRGVVQYMHERLFANLDVVMLEARAGKNYLGQRIKLEGSELLLIQYWLYRRIGYVNACKQEQIDERILAVYNDERIQRATNHISLGMISGLESLHRFRNIDDINFTVKHVVTKPKTRPNN